MCAVALVGCTDDATSASGQPATGASADCTSAARSTVMEAIVRFDEGDISAVDALVAAPSRFKFVSTPVSKRVDYDRAAVTVDLRALHAAGHRFVRSASTATDEAALQVRVLAPSLDPAGYSVAGVSVLYRDAGSVKFQVECIDHLIVGISWDSVATTD